MAESEASARLHERVRSCQNHRNHQCYQQTPQLHHYAENQRRQSIVAIQLQCHRVTPSGLSIKGRCLGLGIRCECSLLGQNCGVYEQLAALESWLQFQHQTAKRHRGFRVHFRPARADKRMPLPLQHWRGCPFSCMNWEIALAIYLFS